MKSTSKVQEKGQVTIPTSLRNKVGIVEGDLVEFSLVRGKIVITPKLIIDRSDFPTADDEYTPAQRRIIDARLAKGLKDIKEGRTAGPFNTANEMIAHLKGELKKRDAAKKLKRTR